MGLALAKNLGVLDASPWISRSWICLDPLLICSLVGNRSGASATSAIDSFIIEGIIVEPIPYVLKLVKLLVSRPIRAIDAIILDMSCSTEAAILIFWVVILRDSKSALCLPERLHVGGLVRDMDICAVLNPAVLLSMR